jgi:protein TonB
MPVSGPQASKLVPGKPIHRVMPQYPEIAKRLRLEGVVVLHAVVSPEGNVGDVKVVSGNTLLHNAALAAVKQWRYSPSLLNGKAVESAVEIRLTFQHPK